MSETKQIISADGVRRLVKQIFFKGGEGKELTGKVRFDIELGTFSKRDAEATQIFKDEMNAKIEVFAEKLNAYSNTKYRILEKPFKFGGLQAQTLMILEVSVFYKPQLEG